MDLFGKKKFNQALEQITKLQTEITELKQRRSKRKIEESYLFTGDLNPDFFGRDKEGRSDLSITDYQTIQKQCYDAFKIFPYAKRVIEIITDFVIGEELTYSIDEDYQEDLTEIMEDFWSDYDNDFNLYLEGMVHELFVLGEQIYPYTIDDTTKIVKLGIVDPRGVDRVLRDRINNKRLAQVLMTNASAKTGKKKFYAVIQEIGGKMGVPDHNKEVKDLYGGGSYDYGGPVFLFNINRLPTQTRGYSELNTMIETLDVLDQFVFEVSERSLLLFQFIADILIKNKDEKEIEAYPVPDPRKNSVFKHNQNVEMKVHSPNLRAVDAQKISKMIISYILAGVGIPEHWIVSSDSSNRSTAKEQNNPIEKRLERKQGIVKYMLKKILRFQFEAKFPKATSRKIKQYVKAVNFDFPSVAGVDRKFRAQVLNETAKSLVIAVNQMWISGEDAAQEYVNIANKFGMELKTLKFSAKQKKELKGLGITGVETGSALKDYFKTIDAMATDAEKSAVGGSIGKDIDMGKE